MKAPSKQVLLHLDPADHATFLAAAKAENLPLVVWIRRQCHLATMPPEPPQIAQNQPDPTTPPEPVRFESPVLPAWGRKNFKPSKDCSGRCQRIGVPSCDPCRKANPA